MSRSKKKNPIGWLCSSKSQAMKQWKNRNDRSLRHKNEEIASGSHYKRMNGARADIWNSPSDGKSSNEWRYENAPWKRVMK
ncbi:MAG: hypothetical protein WA678_05780 [Rhabdochlamydiaceae bacterium]|jgi:hypothetical protein